MSIAMQEWNKEHELSDDIESLFWVLVYAGLHHVKHNNPTVLIGNNIFDEASKIIEDGEVREVGDKADILDTNQLRNFPFLCQPFKDLITRLAQFYAGHYIYHRGAKLEAQNADPEGTCKKKFQSYRKLASDPRWLINVLNEALDKEGWLDNDVVPRSQLISLDAKREKEVVNAVQAKKYDATHLSKTAGTGKNLDTAPPGSAGVSLSGNARPVIRKTANGAAGTRQKSIATGGGHLVKKVLDQLAIQSGSVAGMKRKWDDMVQDGEETDDGKISKEEGRSSKKHKTKQANDENGVGSTQKRKKQF